MKRPALQNKQVVVLRMTFRARKVLGTFEKRAPGINDKYLHRWRWTVSLKYGLTVEETLVELYVNVFKTMIRGII